MLVAWTIAVASLWCTDSCVQMRWLHVPKAGSGFGNLVYRYACNISATTHMPSVAECESLPTSHPWKNGKHSGICNPQVYALEWALPLQCPVEQCCRHLQPPFVQHQPVALERDRGKLVAIFRDPGARLQSMLDMMASQHEHGRKEFEFLRKIGASASCMHRLERVSSRDLTVERFAHVGGNCALACQTKMVLGHECAADVALSKSDATRACDLVGDPRVFLFVGVTDQWSDAVRRFHLRFGGDPDPRDLSNTRSSAARPRVPTTAPSDDPDPVDRALYECVVRRARLGH